MMNSTDTSRTTRWRSQRHPLAESVGHEEALHCNRSFQSAVRLCADPDGRVSFRADLPPGPDQVERAAGAHAEMHSFTPGSRPNATMGDLDEDRAESLAAAARSAGCERISGSGHPLRISLGRDGEEARAVTVGDIPVLHSTALAMLPEDEPCREALLRYALEVTATVRLVRAGLLPEGELAWQVALGTRFSDRFVEHALNALGAIHRVTRPELADLATETFLASAWLHCRAPQPEPTNQNTTSEQ